MNLVIPRRTMVVTKTVPDMNTKSINRFQIHRPALGGVILAALIGIVLVPAASAADKYPSPSPGHPLFVG